MDCLRTICGFAIGTKYTGLIAVPILLACIVLLRWRDLGLENAATKAMAAIAVACVVGSPCYIRNWILLGCPIYPPPPGYKLLCSPKYLSPEAISSFMPISEIAAEAWAEDFLHSCSCLSI